MTPSRQSAIDSIKSSWEITDVADIFNNCSNEIRTKLCQLPSPNDDFFEDETLFLLQDLASVTTDRKDAVKQRLRKRWWARNKGGADAGYAAKQLRVGAGLDGKNESLRVDLRDLIGEFETGAWRERLGKGKKRADVDAGDAGTTTSSTSIATTEEAQTEPLNSGPPSSKSPKAHRAAKRKGKDDDEHHTPTNHQNSDAARSATSTPTPSSVANDSSTDSSHSSTPSSPNTRRIIPSERALATIRTAWSLPTTSALFTLLPRHSFNPATSVLNQPFRNYRNLLIALYRLARVTRGRGEDVGRALSRAFRRMERFDAEKARARLEGVRKAFRRERRERKGD